MILELQIPAAALSMLVRNQIRARAFCDAALHTVGDSSFYVDHIVANGTMSVEEFTDTVTIKSGEPRGLTGPGTRSKSARMRSDGARRVT
jgi:hypothetical protein